MGQVRDTIGFWLWAGEEGEREERRPCYVLAKWSKMVPFTEVGDQKESHV